MTQGLAQISEALEARAWLRLQIEEYRKIVNLTLSTWAQEQLTELTKLDNELATIILGYEGKLG